MDINLIIATSSALVLFATVLATLGWVTTLQKRVKLFAEEVLRLSSENIDMSSALQKMMQEQSQRSLEKTDGFLKFVSDSRDWAFSYIEDVQEKLAKFDKDMDGIVEYYSVYGPDMQGIHVDLLKQVSEAYAELKSVLPKEDGRV